ncbi:MAG: AAA-type ATPase lid domain-containing protein, partial [Planctomycetota bacterium]
DLAAEVRAGRFREDLYYRLRVLKIDVPPLAERGDDVLVLAERFLDELAREFGKERPELSEGARAALLRHPWPGNVRELLNCLRRAMVFAGAGELGEKELGLEAPASSKPAGTLKAVVARVVKETEKRLIEEALARSGGNRTKAAKELGLSRRGLQIKMKRYGVS